MKRTLVLITSNRELKGLTKECVLEFRKAGAELLMVDGGSDISQARNAALSTACNYLRQDGSERDVVLLLDDDMVLSSDGAMALLDGARAFGVPCSGVYAVAPEHDQKVGHSRLAGGPWQGQRFEGGAQKWRMGLGCLAVPTAMLLELEQRSESYAVRGTQYSAFTWSTCENGEWIAEDFRLCQRLGGVRLLPVGAGHVKEITLWPDPSTLEGVRRLGAPPQEKND
jgi:hypothetical protein